MVTRADDLEIHEVPDGYIVYQTAHDRVHYLNSTAAVIFEFCDGRHEPDDIVVRVAQAYDAGPDAHAAIRAGLDALVKEGLVRFPSR